MTKEEYRELIIDAVKTLKIDYEDFIGYTFSDDPKIWLENIHKIFPDTYTYSKLKKDDKRASLVLELYKKLVNAYFKLEKMWSDNRKVFKVINPADKYTRKVGDPAFELFIEKPNTVIFLAGPCPRNNYEEDWRNEAIEYLKEAGFDGVIFNPTNPYYDASDPLYLEKQTEWERKAMLMSDKVVFWIPRTEEHPALTTNIELGEFLVKEKIDKILIGMPDFAVKNEYIKIRLKMLNKHYDTDLKTLMCRVAEETK